MNEVPSDIRVRITQLNIEVGRGERIGLPEHNVRHAFGVDNNRLCPSKEGTSEIRIGLENEPIGLVTCDSCSEIFV